MGGGRQSMIVMEDIAMSTIAKPATIEDLYAVEGKAELVNGEIVHMSPTGRRPGYAADAIVVSLWQYARVHRTGIAVGDNKAFRVNLLHRKSFSPDAAYYIGPDSGMRFFDGAPIFAVEVRSEGDYGPAAVQAMAEKRADYFAAGTKVVWDVDVLADDVVKSYKCDAPTTPLVFRRGETADAEPAVPGWRMPVDEMFE
jgi:Uma2 family endonuclease